MNAQSADVRRLLEARHHDPFAVLGRHATGEGRAVVRAFRPGAAAMTIEAPKGSLPMERIPGTDLFEWHGPAGDVPEQYRLRWEDAQGHPHTAFDPYAYSPQLGELDLHLFGEGRHYHAYRFLGAHPHSIDGVEGVLFATWAPNAERVSVVGDFNDWDGRCHPMRSRGGGGVWELFIPGLGEGMLYKFEIFHQGSVLLKTDPYGRRYELRPNNAAVVTTDDRYEWGDEEWLQRRAEADWQHTPLSVYEMHLGSWQRGEDGSFLNYRDLAHRVVDYVRDMGFTHIELMPVTEHPLDASWGYQASGYYAPTSRFGSPDDFRYFVDHCHRHGIGVFLDWVPAHFPRDTHALARFDGTPLYEHEDPRRGEHRDWGTLIFNFGRNEVKNFLLSSALYWMQEMHLDGLRVDAVASMLYLDYSRDAGDWVPNIHGGRENLEAIEFLREMNRVLHGECPGILTMAEESTSWPMVSRPTWLGGLGFSMKWNMGWMNDTLEYIHKDPVHRKHHHSELTFGLLYAFTENFILPFSHDEVVHMKRSMLDKMPGDDWQRFANLRLLYTYMFTHPGKKLLFMGNEFAHGREWDERQALDWYLLDYAHHRGIRQMVKDLNHLYRQGAGLHYYDFESDGFEWVDCNDADRSLLSYLRYGGGETFLVVLNFTPVPHDGYRVGVPEADGYEVVFNSDSEFYGGSNTGNGGVLESEAEPWMGQPHSVVVTVPPLAGVVLRKMG